MYTKFRKIYHPTDFSKGSQRAFHHALKLALEAQSVLRLVHVGQEETPPWEEFPGVRFTLEGWGLLGRDSLKSDVLNLGLGVQKFFIASSEPERAIANDIQRKDAELVVMATHARHGLSRLLHDSVFRHLLREAKRPILAVPHGVEGFVDNDKGECSLTRILVPVSPEVKPQKAVELVERFLQTLAVKKVEVRLLYVGDESEAPGLQYRDSENVHWDYVTRDGSVVSVISDEIETFKPGLVVMLERGRNTVMDFLIPGKVERLAPETECPLLVQNVNPN